MSAAYAFGREEVNPEDLEAESRISGVNLFLPSPAIDSNDASDGLLPLGDMWDHPHQHKFRTRLAL